MSFSLKKEKAKTNPKVGGIYLEILKGLTIALIISLILILAMALVVTFVEVSDLVMAIINQVIKVVALLIACIVSFKEKSQGWKKGLILGVIYMIAAYIIFSLMKGQFAFGWHILFDLIAGAIMGIICGMFAVNLRKRN